MCAVAPNQCIGCRYFVIVETESVVLADKSCLFYYATASLLYCIPNLHAKLAYQKLSKKKREKSVLYSVHFCLLCDNANTLINERPSQRLRDSSFFTLQFTKPPPRPCFFHCPLADAALAPSLSPSRGATSPAPPPQRRAAPDLPE